jgi:acetyl esterase
MALHLQAKTFLDQLASGGGPPMHEMTPAEIRARATPPDLAGPSQAVHAVADRHVTGPGGPIPVRVYTPHGGRALPGLVFFHGGGFVLGTLDMADRVCRALANAAGCVVINVDYRLAPEHPFPAAVDDAYAVTRYVAEHAAEFGVDPARLAVGGESAGGNLAAVTAILARDRGTPPLAFQLLIYPQVDFEDNSPSMREFDGYFLSRPLLEYFARLLFPVAGDARRPEASPLNAALDGLPPALVVTAECDMVRDQGEAYARKLQQAGVPVTLQRYDGMIHPFFSLSGILDGGKAAIADAAAALTQALRS